MEEDDYDKGYRIGAIWGSVITDDLQSAPWYTVNLISGDYALGFEDGYADKQDTNSNIWI
jgi:hypothetical protein